MKGLNLAEMLKGHEGEIFYTPLIGDVKLIEINSAQDYSIKGYDGRIYIWLTNDGRYFDKPEAECMIFPSKDQRDWNKWIEYNVPKPKTWSQLCNLRWRKSMYANIDENDISIETKMDYPIEKSALALMKIHQLIEVGYGGNVSKEERLDIDTAYWTIIYNIKTDSFDVIITSNPLATIAFHTKEQAEKFLSYPENVQFLKNYYMI